MHKKLRESCQNGLFENYIPIGCCCFLAINLEQLGLRNHSMPFDWNRTKWFAIKNAIETHFSNYLVYDNLYQNSRYRHIYKSITDGVSFPHDFVEYKSLKSQFIDVNSKYQKRINRFFECITKPTLFFRYVWDLEELHTIIDNYEEIIGMLKEFNSNNELVVISHDEWDLAPSLIPENVNLFYVKQDINEERCLNPLYYNKELRDILTSAKFANKEKNLLFYKDKHSKSKKYTLIQRFSKKLKKIQKKYRKTYIHNKVL